MNERSKSHRDLEKILLFGVKLYKWYNIFELETHHFYYENHFFAPKSTRKISSCDISKNGTTLCSKFKSWLKEKLPSDKDRKNAKWGSQSDKISDDASKTICNKQKDQ